MRIHRFETCPALLPCTEFANEKPIHVFVGNYSDVVLDLIRQAIGNDSVQTRIDACNDGSFVLFGLVEEKKKTYDFCFIRNAEGKGEHRIAVNFIPNTRFCSLEDTREYIDLCAKKDKDDRHVFENNPRADASLLSESDLSVRNFQSFMERIKDDTALGDDRPVFIYRFFEKLDEAVDIAPFLSALADCGRQVFACVEKSYDIGKLNDEQVQVVLVDDAAL